MAQFGRAPRSGRGGRKFESCHLDQRGAGQMPAPFQKKNKSNRGVAQVVAHQTGGLGVASSSLVTPTKKELRNSEALFIQSEGLVCNHASACM